MRFRLLLITFSALAASAATATTIPSQLAMLSGLRGPQGIDVSNHQGTIDWKKVKSQGVAFAYIKATEGTNAYFSRNYIGATNNSIIRGAYHFAHPGNSSGAAQATYFLAHGGGWTSDGITLPGAVDLEGDCSGLSASQIVAWIKDFSDTYHSKTKRYPVIYVTTSWWNQCTGKSTVFGSTSPLWIASWASDIGPLPAGWRSATFWQYADSGPYPGDQDLFIGDAAGLSKFAKG
ncbi:glycoside hydrolase family 25 protein [Russula aff. rugulosa BPL654]|nr:glycoside hydrolase family 25 protein [Russula aff. rugulosa BPL654]